MAVTCSKCRYDLTGTPRSGRCPECGQAAGVSYERSALAAVRKPIHPAGRVAIAVCGAGSLSVVGLFVWLAIGVGFDSFLFTLLLWNMSPFIALGLMAYMVGRSVTPAIGSLLTSIGLIAIMWWGYTSFLRANDPLAGMIFMFLPVAGWIGVAIAIVALALSNDRWWR